MPTHEQVPAASLEELELPSNAVSAEGAHAVRALLLKAPNMRRLDLSFNRLGDAGVTVLAETVAALRHLESFGLAANALDDATVGALALALRRAASPLQELELEGNSAADGAMQELLRFAASSSSLSALRIGANAVGPASGAAISAHLVAHASGPLRSLHLSNNSLGDGAAAPLLAALRANTALTDLAVRGAALGAEAEAALEECVERNRRQTREDERKRTKAMLRAVSAEMAARDTLLNAAADPRPQPQPQPHAQPPPTTASAEATTVPDATATPTPTPAEVDPGGAPRAPLLRQPSWTDASLPPPSPQSSYAAAAAAAVAQLESIDETSRDAATAAAGVPAPPTASASEAEPALFTPLGTSRDAPPGGDGEAEGEGDEGGGAVVRGLRELRLLPGAAAVLLAEAELGDEHAPEVADYLRYGATTRVVDLSANNFTDGAVAALAASLVTSAVAELSLAGNNLEGAACEVGDFLGGGGSGDASGEGQAEGSSSGDSGGGMLRRLSLADNLVGPHGGRSLARALPRSSLEELRLESNLLGDEGAAAIAAALAAGAIRLRLLGLGDNRIGDEGGLALAAAIAFCGLDALHLAANAIGEAGCGALVRAARTCAHLRLLDLRGEEQRVPSAAREAAAASTTCSVLLEEE